MLGSYFSKNNLLSVIYSGSNLRLSDNRKINITRGLIKSQFLFSNLFVGNKILGLLKYQNPFADKRVSDRSYFNSNSLKGDCLDINNHTNNYSDKKTSDNQSFPSNYNSNISALSSKTYSDRSLEQLSEEEFIELCDKYPTDEILKRIKLEIKKKSDSPYLRLLKIVFLNRKKQYKKALKAANFGLKKFGLIYEFQRERYNILMKLDEYELALNQINLLMANHSEEERLHESKIICMRKLNYPPEEIEKAYKNLFALNLSPKSCHFIRLNYASWNCSIGNVEAALMNLEILLNGNYPLACSVRADIFQICYDCGKYDRALEIVQSLLQDFRKKVKDVIQNSKSHISTENVVINDSDESIFGNGIDLLHEEYFKLLNPDDRLLPNQDYPFVTVSRDYLLRVGKPITNFVIKIYLIFIDCYLKNSQYHEALEIAQELIHLFPKHPIGYTVKIDIFFNSNQFNKAIELSKFSIEKFPKAFHFWISSFQCYHLLELDDDAEKIINMAATKFPNNYMVDVNRVQLLIVKGDFDEALKILLKYEEPQKAKIDLTTWFVEYSVKSNNLKNAELILNKTLNDFPGELELIRLKNELDKLKNSSDENPENNRIELKEKL